MYWFDYYKFLINFLKNILNVGSIGVSVIQHFKVIFWLMIFSIFSKIFFSNFVKIIFQIFRIKEKNTLIQILQDCYFATAWMKHPLWAMAFKIICFCKCWQVFLIDNEKEKQQTDITLTYLWMRKFQKDNGYLRKI